VYGNVSAAPLETVDAIRHELQVQLVSSVRWTESVHAMLGGGVRRFVELGPKDVLTGLLRRIDESATGVALNSPAALRQFTQDNT
jgi:[acyl-carrier-protein] S-malonyltransferase